MSPASTDNDAFSSSEIIHQPNILPGQARNFHRLISGAGSELMEFLCNRASVVYPVLTFIHLTSKELVVLPNTSQLCLQLADVLVSVSDISILAGGNGLSPPGFSGGWKVALHQLPLNA